MNKMWMAAGLAVVLGACSQVNKEGKADAVANPFFTAYQTPFGVPPFDQIQFADYKPALLKGMEEQKAEIEAIVQNPDAPSVCRCCWQSSLLPCHWRQNTKSEWR